MQTADSRTRRHHLWCTPSASCPCTTLCPHPVHSLLSHAAASSPLSSSPPLHRPRLAGGCAFRCTCKDECAARTSDPCAHCACRDCAAQASQRICKQDCVARASSLSHTHTHTHTHKWRAGCMRHNIGCVCTVPCPQQSRLAVTHTCAHPHTDTRASLRQTHSHRHARQPHTDTRASLTQPHTDSHKHARQPYVDPRASLTQTHGPLSHRHTRYRPGRLEAWAVATPRTSHACLSA